MLKPVYCPKVNGEYLTDVQFGFISDIFDFCCYARIKNFASYNPVTMEQIKEYDLGNTLDLIELSKLVGYELY